MEDKTRRFVRTLLGLGFRSDLNGYKVLLAFFISLAQMCYEEQQKILSKSGKAIFGSKNLRAIDYSIKEAYETGKLQGLNDLLEREVVTYKPGVKQLINLLYQYFRYFK